MPEEAGSQKITESSASVQTHLGILQGVIERMASNSTSCKAWCITIVSAILVVVADKDKPDYVFIALLPTFLFVLLDAYYLGMEKGFRNSYNQFIIKLHNGSITAEDLYSAQPTGGQSKLQWEALKSFSVWGFYSLLVVLIMAAKMSVLK